jgi:short-subunit dehydrogenase
MTATETWIFLGASRGFGRAFLEKTLVAAPTVQAVCLSRKTDQLPALVQGIQSDFSDEQNWASIISKIRELAPRRIFYFAGGGPYGRFQDKVWKAHRWSLKVTFEFPAFLLHELLLAPGSVEQMVFIGSSIAESYPDPQASSYCAGKHALRGLITSIQQEQLTSFDLRLWSPGYMDTSLLPANAWPRQQAGLVQSPGKVAEMLWASIHNADDVNKHFVLQSSP